jgi:hypothetical protein
MTRDWSIRWRLIIADDNAGFDNDFQVETRFLTFAYPVVLIVKLTMITYCICLITWKVVCPVTDLTSSQYFFSLLWPATEPLSAQVDHLFVDGDKAVVIGEFSTRMLATGKVVDSLFHIHLTVEGGLITCYRLLEDSLAVYRALAG